MHNPVRVAGVRVFDCQLLVDGNHTYALWIEEGRTRPSHVMSCFQPFSTVDQAIKGEASLITGRGPCHDRERSQLNETDLKT